MSLVLFQMLTLLIAIGFRNQQIHLLLFISIIFMA